MYVSFKGAVTIPKIIKADFMTLPVKSQRMLIWCNIISFTPSA